MWGEKKRKMEVDDLLDSKKMQPKVARFWEWCHGQGIKSKPLIIADRPPEEEWLGARPAATSSSSSSSPGNNGHQRPVKAPAVRGIFTAEALKPGTVVAVVPFASCITTQTLGLFTKRSNPLFRHLLPSAVNSKALWKTARLGTTESQHLWLTGVVAALKTAMMQQQQPQSILLDRWAPYLDMLPNSYQEEERYVRQVLLPKLPPEHQEAYNDAFVFGHTQVSAFANLTKQVAKHKKISGALPSRYALDWAYRSVISRALVLPSGCQPSAPTQTLQELLMANQNPETGLFYPHFPTVPAMVPLVDMFNSAVDSDTVPDPEELANCTVFTCEEQHRPYKDIEKDVQAQLAAAERKDLDAEYQEKHGRKDEHGGKPSNTRRGSDTNEDDGGDDADGPSPEMIHDADGRPVRLSEAEAEENARLNGAMGSSKPFGTSASGTTTQATPSNRSIVVVAKRHIEPGEELTLGYGDGGSAGVGLYRHGFITSLPE